LQLADNVEGRFILILQQLALLFLLLLQLTDDRVFEHHLVFEFSELEFCMMEVPVPQDFELGVILVFLLKKL